MWNGILNVNKESGYTSNDVVAKLRGILHQKKIGHAGTLDPQAVGVLPVLLGSGCRLSEYMTGHTKTYRTVLRLGVETDTQDMTGNVLATGATDSLTREDVCICILSFRGTYDQIPPMYSAKKVGGRKLYDLARQGVTVERKSVPVTIDEIVIESVDLPEVTFSVSCSRGTYIRTLCADIGSRLGCGGAMQSLVRTRAGGLYLEDALTLDEIRDLALRGQLAEKIIPPEEMFLDCLRVRTAPEADRLLLNGGRLSCAQIGLPERGAGPMVRVCTSAGDFIAVYRFEEGNASYVPYRMLMDL